MSGDLVDDAYGCAVMSRARALARWVGATGRRVTAKGVLRPVDVAEAAKATGVDLPGRVRSAADVELLHHTWLVARSARLLVVDAVRVMAGPGPGADDDPLRVWLAGLDAVLLAESHDHRGRGGAAACRLVLAVLADHPSTRREDIESAVLRLLEDAGDLGVASAMFQAFRRGKTAVDAALGVLADFGAVDDETRLTPLGGRALEQLRDRAGEPVTPDLPAEMLLTRLAAAACRTAVSWPVRGLARRARSGPLG
ncbi:conserved hypothetical protein [Frankia canadensis]|uniref:Uncharacterized protein n=1 Tax=Frankia canadensis TaxID=1836972 RepID=A0A2I2KQG8_9ACTN|nr:hypothetical protein [Frankia canadensis]SNQ47876.1 conserved hypothetical protein [Frankia canadensis]SOU55166.1 conserved hypothetical protein [Frankia canadensis]